MASMLRRTLVRLRCSASAPPPPLPRAASAAASMSTAAATVSRKASGSAWSRRMKWTAGLSVLGGAAYMLHEKFGSADKTVRFILARLRDADAADGKTSILTALSMAVASDAVKEAMVEVGGIEALRDLLGDPQRDLRRLAVQILADISQKLPLTAEIARCDGLLERVFQCVIDQDKELSINSIMVLTFLMNGSPDAKLAAFNRGALNTLLRAVRATDMDVAHFSCACIGALVKDFPQMHLLSALKKDVRDRMVQAIGQVAQSHVALGQRYAAIDGFETALKLDGANATVHNALGQLYSASGQIDMANQHFRDAIKFAPGLVEASYNLAANLTRAGGSTTRKARNEAVDVLFASLAFLNKAHPNRDDVYFLLAQTLDRLDRTPEAIRVVGELLRPGGGAKHLAKGHVELARLKTKLDDLEGAEAALRTALTMQPHDSAAQYALALVQYRSGALQEALESAAAAVRLNPDLENAHFLCGKLHATLGAWNDAFEAFANVAKLNPARADAHYQMGRALEHLGRRREAAAKFGDTMNAWIRQCNVEQKRCGEFFAKHPADQRVLNAIAARCDAAEADEAVMCEAYARLKQVW